MKRLLSFLLTFVYLLHCTSCFMYRTVTTREEFVEYAGKKLVDVLQVHTRTGQSFSFCKEFPGKISDSVVTGTPQVVWKFGEIDSIGFSRKQAETVWKNGIRYALVTQDSAGFVTLMREPVFISLSNIDSLSFKKYQPHKTGLIIVGAQAFLVGIFMILLFTWDPLTDFFFPTG